MSMVTAKWLFRHLPRSDSKCEIDSAKQKQENRRFVMTKAFAESSVSCGNSELFQAEQVTFFLWELMFLIEPTPDASVNNFVEGQMLGCSSLLNGGGLKSAETIFSRRLYVPQTG